MTFVYLRFDQMSAAFDNQSGSNLQSQHTRLITSSADKHYSLDFVKMTFSQLLKCQSPTTVLFRTTLHRKITPYKLLRILKAPNNDLDCTEIILDFEPQ